MLKKLTMKCKMYMYYIITAIFTFIFVSLIIVTILENKSKIETIHKELSQNNPVIKLFNREMIIMDDLTFDLQNDLSLYSSEYVKEINRSKNLILESYEKIKGNELYKEELLIIDNYLYKYLNLDEFLLAAENGEKEKAVEIYNELTDIYDILKNAADTIDTKQIMIADDYATSMINSTNLKFALALAILTIFFTIIVAIILMRSIKKLKNEKVLKVSDYHNII